MENKRKSFKSLLEKYERYERYYDTEQCKEEWKDFRTFTVVTQMRSDEARQNILTYLAGEPALWNGKRLQNDRPIKRNNFWFFDRTRAL